LLGSQTLAQPVHHHRHDGGFDCVPAVVVQHSDKMAAPLRQRHRNLRGRVADDETLIWFDRGFASLPSRRRRNCKANKKRP
jgi:cystathionine beta-lyase/cystathionine gamma-synthase